MEKLPHQIYMKRALDLAALGLGQVAPNPMVGCVIVHQGKIIGEGYHQSFGGPHAEVNAINSVKDQSLLSSSTLYVTLEPCSHHGKTPPCVSLILQVGIPKVVIAHLDPNPLVSGRGIRMLQSEGGVEVITGVLEEEANQLNRRFFTFMTQKRPFVILKWAQTSDGFLARKNYDARWISNIYSRTLVHRWRSEEAAILVGKNTALHDDPRLTTRLWTGKDPLRVVFDRFLRLPSTLHLFDQSTPTICINTLREDSKDNLDFAKVSPAHFLEEALEVLYQKGIQSVIVEGGAKVLELMIQQDLWDEARIFESNTTFGEGIQAPSITAKLIARHDIIGDILKIKSRDTKKSE